MSKLNKKQLSTSPRAIKQRIYRMKNLAKCRKQNREAAQRLRDNGWQEDYFKPYFTEWYANPTNKRIHGIRTRIASIGHTLRKKNSHNRRMGDVNAQILKNLYAIGWSEHLEKSKCINHVCSVFFLVHFNSELDDRIICDVLNMEIVNKKSNNSIKKRTVTEKVIQVAKKLEKKYKKELKGFTKYITQFKGVVL
jgi:hypothetical protein